MPDAGPEVIANIHPSPEMLATGARPPDSVIGKRRLVLRRRRLPHRAGKLGLDPGRGRLRPGRGGRNRLQPR